MRSPLAEPGRTSPAAGGEIGEPPQSQWVNNHRSRVLIGVPWRNMDANNATAALPLSGKRVMVLEDDVFVKMGLESTLLEAGAQIGTLAHLKTVDAAILDVRL